MSIRSLSPPKNYYRVKEITLPLKREALAIVQGVKHFRTYLQGSKFTIETDDNPLTQLGNPKDSHGRLARWVLSLQQCDFTIVHRSGSKNANADGLSRDQWSLTKVGGLPKAQEQSDDLID